MPAALSVATPYEEHRDYVLAVLGRRCGWLEPSDREAVFHDAYAVFLEKQRDGQLEAERMQRPQVRAYLTQTALNKAMDEGKRAWRRRSTPLGDRELELPAGTAGIEEVLAKRFDSARMHEILDELPERQQTVVKLRFFFDRSPREIQDYLGVTERAYRRDLERAMRQIAERFELVRAGTFCESRKSLILAYVAGIAGPNRMIEARRHIETCPACARLAGELRVTAGQAAAAISLPLPLLLDDRRLASFRAPLGVLRDRIAELLGTARDHAAGAAARFDVSTPWLAGGARPGALTATVLGCLAVGGGATYCAVAGLPAPVRSLIRGPTAAHRPTVSAREADRIAHVRAASSAPTASSKGRVPVRPPTMTPRVTTSRATTSPATLHASHRTHAKHHRHRATSRATKTPSQLASASASTARRVEQQTAPEFGVEGGSSGPAPSSTSTHPSTSGGRAGGAASEFDP